MFFVLVPQRRNSGGASAKKSNKKVKTAPRKDVSMDCLNEVVITPIMNNKCRKRADQMQAGTWTDWDKRGKWHSIILTIAALWILNEKEGHLRGDTETAKAEFLKEVATHDLILKEQERVDKNADDKVDYAEKYAKKVWTFIHVNFTTPEVKNRGDPPVRWIYKEFKKRGDEETEQPYFYEQDEFMFTMKWPLKKDHLEREEHPDRFNKLYFEGEVDHTWHQKLLDMGKLRDARCKYTTFVSMLLFLLLLF